MLYQLYLNLKKISISKKKKISSFLELDSIIF